MFSICTRLSCRRLTQQAHRSSVYYLSLVLALGYYSVRSQTDTINVRATLTDSGAKMMLLRRASPSLCRKLGAQATQKARNSCLMQVALVSEMLKPTAEPWSLLGYVHRPGTEDGIKGISHWVVTDLDTQVCNSASLARQPCRKIQRTSCLCRARDSSSRLSEE